MAHMTIPPIASVGDTPVTEVAAAGECERSIPTRPERPKDGQKFILGDIVLSSQSSPYLELLEGCKGGNNMFRLKAVLTAASVAAAVVSCAHGSGCGHVWWWRFPRRRRISRGGGSEADPVSEAAWLSPWPVFWPWRCGFVRRVYRGPVLLRSGLLLPAGRLLRGPAGLLSPARLLRAPPGYYPPLPVITAGLRLVESA